MKNPEHILLTSTSRNRFGAVTHIFPESQVISMPGTEQEEETPDLERVARQKVVDAMRVLESGSIDGSGRVDTACFEAQVLRNLASEQSLTLAVAADVNNAAGGIDFFPKPGSLEEARSCLSKVGFHGFYDVVAATAIKNGLFVSGTQKSRVVLNSTGIQALSTRSGQDQYIGYINQNYGPEMLTKLSGGIMLEALLVLNWVDTVNSVALDSRGSEHEAIVTLNLALTSMVPGVLGILNSRIEDRVHRNPLLHEAYESVQQDRCSRPQ